MEGVTNAAVREVLASYGPVGLVCTEFVRIAGEAISPPYLRRQVEKVAGVPLSVQVMGNDPELMAEAGAVVARAGADVVDLNLGCPTHNAARKGVGAALYMMLYRLAPRQILEGNAERQHPRTIVRLPPKQARRQALFMRHRAQEVVIRKAAFNENLRQRPRMTKAVYVEADARHNAKLLFKIALTIQPLPHK